MFPVRIECDVCSPLSEYVSLLYFCLVVGSKECVHDEYLKLLPSSTQVVFPPYFFARPTRKRDFGQDHNAKQFFFIVPCFSPRTILLKTFCVSQRLNGFQSGKTHLAFQNTRIDRYLRFRTYYIIIIFV